VATERRDRVRSASISKSIRHTDRQVTRLTSLCRLANPLFLWSLLPHHWWSVINYTLVIKVSASRRAAHLHLAVQYWGGAIHSLLITCRCGNYDLYQGTMPLADKSNKDECSLVCVCRLAYARPAPRELLLLLDKLSSQRQTHQWGLAATKGFHLASVPSVNQDRSLAYWAHKRPNLSLD